MAGSFASVDEQVSAAVGKPLWTELSIWYRRGHDRPYVTVIEGRVDELADEAMMKDQRFRALATAAGLSLFLILAVWPQAADGGDLLLVTASEDGAIGFLTPHRAVPLPDVGLVGRNLNFDLNASLVPYPSSTSQNTVTSNDSAAGSWTRTQTLANSTVTYSTTLFANRPRRGYVFRPAADVTASDGRTTRHPGYGISQRVRKRIEEAFGWIKTVEWLQWYDVRSEPGGTLDFPGR